MKKLITLLFVTSILFASCSDDAVEKEKIIEIKRVSLNAEDTTSQEPRVKGQGHSGAFSFRMDSAHIYSAGFIEYLPDSLLNSNLRICVNYWTKSTAPAKGQGMAVSFQDNEKGYVWATIEPINYGAKANEWVNVIDSVNVSADVVNKKGLFFKVFGYSNDKASILDVDDISIVIKKIAIVTED